MSDAQSQNRIEAELDRLDDQVHHAHQLRVQLEDTLDRIRGTQPVQGDEEKVDTPTPAGHIEQLARKIDYLQQTHKEISALLGELSEYV